MNLSIAPLIPAYRLSSIEVQNLLDRLPQGYENPTIVHNDTNEDLSIFLDSLEMKRLIKVVSIPFQVGKSEAIRRGLHALLEASTAEIVVQVDGHLKQAPEDITKLVQRLVETNSHMVVTNRYGFQNMEGQVHRVAVSGLFSTIIKKLTGYKLHDTVCGTRAYVRDLAHIFCHRICSFGYGLEVEEILISSLHSFLVEECSTRTNRQADATNAGKLEDNLFALISYANDLKMSDEIREVIHFMLAKIKQRKSFELDMKVFDENYVYQFEYAGRSEESVVAAYASGTAIDGYSVSRTTCVE